LFGSGEENDEKMMDVFIVWYGRKRKENWVFFPFF